MATKEIDLSRGSPAHTLLNTLWAYGGPTPIQRLGVHQLDPVLRSLLAEEYIYRVFDDLQLTAKGKMLFVIPTRAAPPSTSFKESVFKPERGPAVRPGALDFLGCRSKGI